MKLYKFIAFLSGSLFLSLAMPASTFAQYFAEEHWHQGFAIVESGDTLQGLLQYNTDTETLQVRGASSVQTYSSRKLLAFQFQDSQLNINRLFYVFPFPKVSEYPTPIFFELLERGKAVTLLQREMLVVRTINNRPFWGAPTVFTPVPVQVRHVEPIFYFFYESGKVKRFNGSRKQLASLLPNYNSSLKKYIKDKGLNPKRIDDLIQIIRYYNEQNP
jgi:hypothetical protein